jgi:hypothetical protein
MKPAKLLFILPTLLSILASPLSWAEDGNDRQSSVPVLFSAADFDWRDIIPYLYQASALPGDQGLRLILENSKVLRAYVAMDVQKECKPGNGRCNSSSPDFTVDAEIRRRIDGIIKEGLSHQRGSSFVDYSFDRQTSGFSQIAALRSDKKQDAYLVLRFADRAYSSAQLQAKYGPPDDTDIFQWYSVFIYRAVNSRYTSKAVFEVNPVDGAVIKVAISVKPKKHH